MPEHVFISYSHDDADFVTRLAEALNQVGVKIWMDRWELQPGDSIVSKIYEEGLANSALFLIVLSKASVGSSWVRDELDVATVQRLEKVTRVIPVLKEDCDIPASLRALLWVDMRKDFDAGVKRISDVYHGVSSRPTLGNAPDYVQKLKADVEGLSKRAATIAAFFASSDSENGPAAAFNGEAIHEATGLGPDDVNDGVDELKEQGLVKTLDWFGTIPFDFGQAEPTYALFLRLKKQLAYDPEEDIRAVVAAIAALGNANGPALAARTKLPTNRLNRAMEYIEDYGLAQVVNFFGTAPFTFGDVLATRRTRSFAESKAV